MSTGGALVMLMAAVVLLATWVLVIFEKRKMAAYRASKARLQAEAAASRP